MKLLPFNVYSFQTIQMYRYLSFFMLGLFLFSCQSSIDKPMEVNKLKSSETMPVTTTNFPKNFKDFFFLLPDDATEVIGMAGGNIGETFNKMTEKDGVFELNIEEAEQSAKFYLFEHKTDFSKSILGLTNASGQTGEFHLFTFEEGKAVLQEVDYSEVFPEISINEYLDENNPVDWEDTPNFYLEGNNRIWTSIYTWMIPKYENIEFKYDINLLWDGEKFSIDKKLIKK